jgi:hypothetical protein
MNLNLHTNGTLAKLNVQLVITILLTSLGHRKIFIRKGQQYLSIGFDENIR